MCYSYNRENQRNSSEILVKGWISYNIKDDKSRSLVDMSLDMSLFIDVGEGTEDTLLIEDHEYFY